MWYGPDNRFGCVLHCSETQRCSARVVGLASPRSWLRLVGEESSAEVIPSGHPQIHLTLLLHVCSYDCPSPGAHDFFVARRRWSEPRRSASPAGPPPSNVSVKSNSTVAGGCPGSGVAGFAEFGGLRFPPSSAGPARGGGGGVRSRDGDRRGAGRGTARWGAAAKAPPD